MAISLTRRDPVLESLESLGTSLRGASTDLSTQRQQELARLGLLQQAEQQRQTADLQRIQVETQGQTGLLETQMKLADVEERVRMSRERAGREAAEEVQRQALRPFEVAEKKFQVEQTLPAQLKTYEAQQGAATSARRASDVQYEKSLFDLNRLRNPVNPVPIVAAATEVYGQAGADALQRAFPNFFEKPPSGAEFRDWMEFTKLTSGKEMLEMDLAHLMRQRNALSPDADPTPLDDQITRIRQVMTTGQVKNLSPEDAGKVRLDQMIAQMQSPDVDPLEKATLNQLWPSAMTRRQATTNQELRPMASPLEEAFVPLANRTVGAKEPDRERKVNEVARELANRYGTPAYMQAFQTAQADFTKAGRPSDEQTIHRYLSLRSKDQLSHEAALARLLPARGGTPTPGSLPASGSTQPGAPSPGFQPRAPGVSLSGASQDVRTIIRQQFQALLQRAPSIEDVTRVEALIYEQGMSPEEAIRLVNQVRVPAATPGQRLQGLAPALPPSPALR